MALTSTRLATIVARLLPFGLALVSVLVAACNNGSGGTGY